MEIILRGERRRKSLLRRAGWGSIFAGLVVDAAGFSYWVKGNDVIGMVLIVGGCLMVCIGVGVAFAGRKALLEEGCF